MRMRSLRRDRYETKCTLATVCVIASMGNFLPVTQNLTDEEESPSFSFDATESAPVDIRPTSPRLPHE